MRLHLGGAERAPGWIVVDVQPGPAVDVVAACDALPFAAGVAEEIYASHVYEHLGYFAELPRALAEAHRVLAPGGALRISVPDLDTLARLLLTPGRAVAQRFHLMRMLFGGQMDAHDLHRVGLAFDFLERYLAQAGFARVERVAEHGLFDDSSTIRVDGELISLNVVARR